MPLTLHVPTHPWRGLRGNDPAGSGAFGASRGPTRTHPGQDILIEPGDAILSPGDGLVTRLGTVYRNSGLRLIVIDSNDATYILKYVLPDENILGTYVKAGQHIGTAQDVAAYYRGQVAIGKAKTVPRNHIHLELRVPQDPAPYMPPDPLEAA